MKICTSCGTTNLDSANFCIDCGKDLTPTASSSDPKKSIPSTIIANSVVPDPISPSYVNPNAPNIPINSEIKTVSLNKGSITLGRDATATIQLDSPMVSRRHATIQLDANGNYVLSDHSTNGIFVNGQRVERVANVSEGDIIRIGIFTLIFRGDKLELVDAGDRIRLDIDRLILETAGKRRLDNLSFAIEPGQFVAFVGGSGAGKSTLMRTLLGTETASSGGVYINGSNLRQNFDIYRNQIGYVPQDDIIHLDLTVEEVLTYAAKLRLPPDSDLPAVINQALDDIKIAHRRTALIKDLSGGQRKRVSIGVELLANPKLFFLDEPTSGLDPGLDKQMMELLRDLAHKGNRTIAIVTHATANITDCDRILFLGTGGKLCYFGTPTDALVFFGVDNFANIYIKLQQDSAVDEYVRLYLNSPYFHKYIGNPLNINSTERNSKTPIAKKANPHSQWLIFTFRYLSLLTRDWINLGLALFTAPVSIFLLSIVLRNRKPFLPDVPDVRSFTVALQLLFVITCASLWVGLASSAQEIVKESAIYLRERLVNLRLRSYLGSKFTVLGILAIVQTILITITIIIGFEDPNPTLISWPLGIFISTLLTLTASFCLGLLVSVAVKNQSQANSVLPLLLLPQIIFSGVLFKLQDPVTIISGLVLSRWAMGSYGTILNVNKFANKYSPSEIVYEDTWRNLSFNWLMLLIHITIYLGIAAYLQKRKDVV